MDHGINTGVYSCVLHKGIPDIKKIKQIKYICQVPIKEKKKNQAKHIEKLKLGCNENWDNKMQNNENTSIPPKILQVYQCNCKHRQGKIISNLFRESQDKLKWDYCFILHENHGGFGTSAVSLRI